MSARPLLAALAALHGFVGVAVAAVGAHVVADADYRPLMTGAGIEIAHALAALVALALLPGRWAGTTAALFVIGALLFAGAIDMRVFAGIHLGPIAPAGGLLLMAGWLVLAGGAMRSLRQSR